MMRKTNPLEYICRTPHCLDTTSSCRVPPLACCSCNVGRPWRILMKMTLSRGEGGVCWKKNQKNNQQNFNKNPNKYRYIIININIQPLWSYADDLVPLVDDGRQDPIIKDIHALTNCKKKRIVIDVKVMLTTTGTKLAMAVLVIFWGWRFAIHPRKCLICAFDLNNLCHAIFSNKYALSSSMCCV